MMDEKKTYWMDEYTKAGKNAERKLVCAVHIMIYKRDRKIVESWVAEVEKLFKLLRIAFPKGYERHDVYRKRDLLYKAWLERQKKFF